MRGKKSAKSLLLLEDVVNLGKKGELVSAKPGFVRNYLLPQKKATIADKRTMRMQARLRAERAEQAKRDEKEAREFATKIKSETFVTHVRTDKEGHLYGSVSVADILNILKEAGLRGLERRNVILPKPIKTVGTFEVRLRLKEDVPASFRLKVIGEGNIETVRVYEAPKVEAQPETGGEETTSEGQEEAKGTEDVPDGPGENVEQ
ncbi:MAG: 50S ribosomal protein L9 [Simkaniaceae bacterium]|nr:50S ribosomal protein L9 [Simkaniaceae bacterium]